MVEFPDWQPLNGAALPSPGAGRVVALVASEGAAGEWGAKAAVELARGWAREGGRVMLVDAALTRPSLHGELGLPNREGLTDATLYGASMSRVAQAPEGERFLLVTAGTAVANADTVAGDERWARIAGSTAEAGVTLALYLEDGEEGAVAFLGSASDIVVLAGPDEDPPSSIRNLEPLVRAVLGPSGAPPSAAAAADDGAPAAPASSNGFARMVVLVVMAIVIAAALGFLLSSGGG